MDIDYTWREAHPYKAPASASRVMLVCVGRMLTVEEKERVQKEEKLHKADKNIALAMEELNNYR